MSHTFDRDKQQGNIIAHAVDALQQSSAEHCRAYMRHCGYSKVRSGNTEHSSDDIDNDAGVELLLQLLDE